MQFQRNADLKKTYEGFIKKGSIEYRSNVTPIWCPGCGDFAASHGVGEALNNLGVPSHKVAIASGIGCSGRFPFFFKTFGFHGLHGRVLPLASGIKLGNPELTVLAVGGDGDGLGIGGGHFPHACRRNIDITYILLDNNIYGLTKGQTSPTAPQGTVSKSTPLGSESLPLDAVTLSLSYNASFISRCFSGDPMESNEIIEKAIAHKGFSLVHMLSMCIEFNKEQTYEYYRERIHKIPQDWDASNRKGAMELSLDEEKVWTGIFYKDENRPTMTGMGNQS